MKAKRPSAAALLLAAGLTMTACSSDPDTEASGGASSVPDVTTSAAAGSSLSESRTSESSSPSSDLTERTQAAVSALETAADAVPNGRPFDLETDTYRSDEVWDVKVASGGNEFHLYISEDGSSVVNQEQDEIADDDAQKVAGVQLSAVDALKQVAGQYGGDVSEIEIDTENGKDVWQIELNQSDGTELEVTIDANTGDEVHKSAGD